MSFFDSVSSSATSFYETVSAYAYSHHDGLVALSLFAGVVVAFSGRTLLKPTVFLLGFIPSTVVLMAVGLAFVRDGNPDHTSLLEGIAIAVALLVGVLVGVVTLRLLFRIATFVLCANFGAVLVFVFHLFLLEPITDQKVLFLWIFIAVIAALVAGLFSVSYPETGIILGTAFDGSALAVFSLARFLGHRPAIFQLGDADAATNFSVWWSITYGTATLLLGVFGALTQRQVAVADEIIANYTREKRRNANTSHDPMAQTPYVDFPEEEHQLLALSEPPHTPLHMRSGVGSPGAGSGYGAIVDEPTYSVTHNLGAVPLGISAEHFQGSVKNANGPHPL